MSEKSEFLLIFRGAEWYRGLSPERIREIMVEWMVWSDRLVEEGRTEARRSLGGRGKVVSGRNAQVSDGPFAEAKEAVGGYFHLEVNDLDEAVAIARQCPLLAYGMTVEVRPLRARCPASELATASLEDVARMIVSLEKETFNPPAAMQVAAASF